MTAVPARFVAIIGQITGRLVDKPADTALRTFLEDEFPSEGALFTELQTLCRQGVVEGWLCTREADGIKFGRVIKPNSDSNGFSVDVVDMHDVVGPHHVHPKGEIDMVMPFDAEARFDGAGKGWTVYGPGSAHKPTVTGGRALILYLLPGGEIAFTPA